MGREDYPPKYRGIYDKAMTGRSPISAIKLKCLDCMAGYIKAIRYCSDITCSLHLYRPYQKIPWRAHRPTNTSKLSRSATGQIIGSSTNSGSPVTKVISIPNPGTERFEVKLTVEPK